MGDADPAVEEVPVEAPEPEGDTPEDDDKKVARESVKSHTTEMGMGEMIVSRATEMGTGEMIVGSGSSQEPYC